jgi:uncharacterized RDD family membrane protein YckC
MKTFKEFIETALEFAFDLYTIVGGVVLLFMVYGFLWLIVSMIWKKIHKPSYLYVVNTILTTFGKKPVKEEEENIEEKKESASL